MRVKAKSVYTFEPCGWDVWDPPFGILSGLIKSGDKVRVVKLRGCPAPNTMNHCHVETVDGRFAGLVSCNSLFKPRKLSLEATIWKHNLKIKG
jgi:hypothetical protein